MITFDVSDYVPLVNLFGVYFQIRDDYMNLQSTEVREHRCLLLFNNVDKYWSLGAWQYSTNKGFAEDLTEGKFSFPIVHGVRTDPSNRVILSMFQSHVQKSAMLIPKRRRTSKTADNPDAEASYHFSPTQPDGFVQLYIEDNASVGTRGTDVLKSNHQKSTAHVGS